MIEVKLKGWEQVGKMLRSVPDVVQNRALKPAIRQGSNIVRDEARDRAPTREEAYPPSRTATFSLKAWRAVKKAGGIETRYLTSGKHRKAYKRGWEFRRPGTLRRSIFVGEAPKNAKTLARQYGRDGVFLAVGVSKIAYYGIFFEGPKGFKDRGGKRHILRQFLKPSLINNADDVLEKIRTLTIANLNKIQAGG